MLTYFDALWLGALQGFTELFPVSSLGHTVILPSLFGSNVDQHAEFFLVFIVATHFATAVILALFYFNDWMRIAAGFFRSVSARRIPENDAYARLAWLLIVATIPAGALGLAFEGMLEELFASPFPVAIFLMLNGLMFFGIELLWGKKRANGGVSAVGEYDDTAIAKISFSQAVRIGFMQCFALLPGFSRTGATIGGGLMAGLSHKDSARFSFLMASPIIGAAAALKLPHLVTAYGSYPVGPTILGVAVSALAAYLSVRFLAKYFKTQTLVPFAIYCTLAGLFFAITFFTHPPF